MRVEWSPSLPAAGAKRDPRAAGADGSFAETLGADEAGSARASVAPPSIDNLFVLQEVSDAVTGRKRAAQRGDALLDRLEDLRLALLAGTLPRGQLETLRRLSRERVEPGDERLAAILGEIDLRVAVELAKLDAA